MSGTAVQDTTWQGSFWLPQNISPMTGGQDNLFYFIYGLSVFFFIVVVGFMVYFAWKYRKKKEGERTTDIHGNTKLEIIWSVIPAILFIIIFAWGFLDWVKLNQPPQDSIEVKVIGRKWDWLFIDGKSGAETSDLIVPINTPVRLTMVSADVIHGFYVPDFRINRDVLPNQYTVLWFKAEKEGNYPILCTQYCGTKHSQMVRYVRVVSEPEYQKAMLAAQGAGLTPAQLGKKIFEGKGACASCHDVSKSKVRSVGPPLFGSYNEEQAIILANGKKETVKFDDNYIRESILNPNVRVVVGYPSVMPSYQGQFNDKELNALVEYMKSLK
ncbi:MAG: cytochrome c oxidase subunit II [Spirobacillus cienkowskii]|uniref:Cytochrome c oxidase subunit 2 n=1 Tax=Spirobacillus cienkowskii TaxID=495820 RepID=A0A369KTJ0_9BACT|nr:MAG: cytochrome c oxidase subunit II [Spirobacillus cienkowskii]